MFQCCGWSISCEMTLCYKDFLIFLLIYGSGGFLLKNQYLSLPYYSALFRLHFFVIKDSLPTLPTLLFHSTHCYYISFLKTVFWIFLSSFLYAHCPMVTCLNFYLFTVSSLSLSHCHLFPWQIILWICCSQHISFLHNLILPWAQHVS